MLEHKDKQKIIEKNLHIPKKNASVFWSREIKLFNSIYKKFPHEKFWKSLNTSFKLNSLSFFKTKEGEEELLKKLKSFNLGLLYKPREFPQITIGEKCGEDIKYTEIKKTLKQFLKDDRNNK